jgi:biopolymer transport protein ExbD
LKLINFTKKVDKMSEVQVKDEGGGGKNKQKKQTLRVDFTPMVDMNMLLITFFMFCTTLLKPQTMNINMPSKDGEELTDDEKNQARESTALTILLAGNDEIYYYEGKLAKEKYDDPNFLIQTNYSPDGLRKLLLEKNKGTYEKIQDLKAQWQEGLIVDSVFRQESKKIQDDAMKVQKIAPTVMIKPTDLSTYKNVVDALDEMLVCNIGAYAIIELVEGDHYLLYKKTDNGLYLTEEQIAEAQKK